MLHRDFQVWQKHFQIFLISNAKIYKCVPKNLSKTWDYCPLLQNQSIEYASIYCHGKSLEEVCPEPLKEDLKFATQKIQAFIRAFKEAKININEIDIFESIPEKYLINYCNIKDKITEHVLKTYQRPENYDFLLTLLKTIDVIKNQNLNINSSSLKNKLGQFKTRKLYKALKNIKPHVSYDMFKTKTGRLTTIKNSFPILTLDKSHRSILEPNNDWFIELDFNAAELRTLLALSGKRQPTEDLHEWNMKNVYNNTLNRKEAKERVFAWLYNQRSNDYFLSRAYDREIVKNKFWDGENVKTIFDRQIPADGDHALNYIIQSTTSDLFLKRMIKIDEILKDKATTIAFSLHDSLVLDFSVEDKDILRNLIDVFSDTDLGKYKINLKAGKNFGSMVELKTTWKQ